MLKKLARISSDSMHLGLMLALTFSTGIIDAVGYLGLDRVFTGNMTGNVVILGMALAGGSGLPILGPTLALVGFMAGAALGGRVLKKAGGGWTGGTTVLFGLVAALLLTVAGFLFAVDEELTQPVGISITTILGAAMGVQAATARFIAVKDVTTVVVTSTITGLAADSVLGAGKSAGSVRRATAVILILLGALVGAALLKWHLGGGLLLAGIVTLAVTILGAVHARQAFRG